MKAPIRLGPFALEAPLGRGGMAEVWKGRHEKRGLEVAIKVITAVRARQERFLRAFKNEVQAVARLDHPGIVMVLDHGEVDEEAASLAQGRLFAGSPYLVMELASWGSLDRVPLPLPADELFNVLFQLLDALAHAHARGVVHRDLKPGNVLLAAPFDARPGLKLTDFGIAHALDVGDRLGESARPRDLTSGTPHFMAPEQFMGHWRDYGPWTDLYALGAMAHQLATGRMPFTGDGSVQLAYAHLHNPPPRIEEPGLPDSFSTWVSVLLEKQPSDRFQKAADAAFALHKIRLPGEGGRRRRVARDFVPTEASALGQGPTASLGAAVPTHQEGTLMTLATVIGEDAAPFALPWPSSSAFSSGSGPGPGSGSGSVRPYGLDEMVQTVEIARAKRRPGPPLPKSWKRTDGATRTMVLEDAGLSLYGLRTIPLIDRDAERTVIWSALAEAHEQRSARFLVLRGAAGNGKSRLVEWMAERADEVGGAVVLKAVHGPRPGPADGLARMVARHLVAVDLDRTAAIKRIDRVLRLDGVVDPDEGPALLELLMPAKAGDPGLRVRHATERHVLIRRYLERLSQARPVILWIEDAQWASDTLAFLLHLEVAQARSPHPILALITVREEALAERPVEARLLEQLEASRRARKILVPPLSLEDQKRLVNALLVLEDQLALEVANRTGGNPLFAVQLVGDWVARGVLEVGDRGFLLEAGETAELPDDLHQVWGQRIDQVLGGQSLNARRALELAATLGQAIDANEWQEAAKLESIVVPPLLLITLHECRLVEPTESGFSFAHGMLRESIERTAKEAGRLEAHHLACARMLESKVGYGGIAERRGRHLFSAGEKRLAVGPLLRGAEELFLLGELAEAQLLLKLREDALEQAGMPEADPAHGEGWILRARIQVAMGHFDDAQRSTDRAMAAALLHSQTALLPETHLVAASIAFERGDSSAALEAYERAKTLYEGRSDLYGVACCWSGLGEVTYRLGDHQRAEALHQKAIAILETVPGGRSSPAMMASLISLGFVALWRGDTTGAQAHFLRQRAILLELGDRLRLARCIGALGETARQAGRLDEAEAHYRKALAIDLSIGSKSAFVDHLNLGLVLLARGDFAGARTVLEEAQTSIGGGKPAQRFVLHCQLLPSLAEARAWSEWDEHFEKAEQLGQETGITDGDVAWLYGLAAERAALAQSPERAKGAYALARRQWQNLGRADRAAEVDAALAAL